MKIKDLDTVTRRVVFAAKLMARYPSNKRLRHLQRAVETWDSTHEEERTNNMLRALFDEKIVEHTPKEDS